MPPLLLLQARKNSVHQQAKSLELRAAVSLSRLWQQQGKQQEARELLGAGTVVPRKLRLVVSLNVPLWGVQVRGRAEVRQVISTPVPTSRYERLRDACAGQIGHDLSHLRLIPGADTG